jgi:hypothetical protein
VEWEEARENPKGFNEEMSGCFAEQKRVPDSSKRCEGEVLGIMFGNVLRRFLFQ